MARSILTVAAATAGLFTSVLAKSPIVADRAPSPPIVLEAQAQLDPAADILSNYVLRLEQSNITSASSGALRRLLGHSKANRPAASAKLRDLGGYEYVAQIEWAGLPTTVIVDTGSSDTWLIQKNFTCLTAKGKQIPEKQCAFGPVFNGTFQHGQIKDVNFYIEYGDGEFVYGPMGYEDVTVAGLTASKQTVALGNKAYWEGDGTTSGLLGLAYPALTDEYPGTDPANDDPNNTIVYDPVFTTLYKQKKIPPVFSVALERGKKGGYLALGGLPPVEADGPFASSKLLITKSKDIALWNKTRSFYTVNVEAYHFGTGDSIKKSSLGANTLAILDTGTTLAFLPPKLVKALAASYDPPAKYSKYFGGLAVPCNATAPNFGVQLGGKVFVVSPKDMIYQNVADPKTGECMVGIEGNGGDINILGDTFLNNVIAVFDVGAAQVRIAQHNY